MEETVKSTPLNLSNNNFFINTNWRGLISSKWVLKTGGSFTSNSDDYSKIENNLNQTLRAGHAKITAKHEINAKIHLLIGTEYFYKSFQQIFSKTGTAGDSTNGFTEGISASFAEAEVYTSAKFVVKGGIRFEYSDYFKKSTLSPRLSTAYKFNDKSQLSLAYGWFYQDPGYELMIDNKFLQNERASHLILSFQNTRNGRTLRVEAYYKKYADLIKYSTDEGFQKTAFNNNGNGYATGIDVFWRDDKTIKNGQYWISYSYLQTERNYNDYPGLAIPDYTNTHTVSFVYKHWIENWRSLIGMTFQYGSPRPYNDPNTNGFNQGRLKPFRTLNISWSYLYKQNIIFHASVSNIPGFNNVYGYNYSPFPNESGVFERTEILPAAKRFFFIGCFITLSKKGELNQLDKIN